MNAPKKKHIEELCGLFLKIHSKSDASSLLKDLLTPQELESIAERLQIFKLIEKGVPHRKISHDLKVSISKVTRGSHALKISKSIIKRIAKMR